MNEKELNNVCNYLNINKEKIIKIQMKIIIVKQNNAYLEHARNILIL